MLTLAQVALVLGVTYWGLIVLRLFSRSFDFWIESSLEIAKLISQAPNLYCEKRTLPLRVLLNGRVVALQFFSVFIEVLSSFVLDDNYGAQDQKRRARTTQKQRMTLKNLQMTRQQNSMSFNTRRIKIFGTKVSKICPRVKSLISHT